ncbi:MAG TPA: hypothetical protein VJ843_02470 [Candidatus Saccharimonadales bacterium]|nr:hypothetical protein [Candidatus Saccharimonadales bacterium]
MKQRVRAVHYEHPTLGPISAERVQPNQVDESLAYQVRRLIGVAYNREFESELTPPNVRLPLGRISGAYIRSTPEQIEAQHTRIEKAIAGGSAYWLLRLTHSVEDANDDRLDALTKTTPSRESWLQKLHATSPNCYVDDILVRPPSPVAPGVQNKGIGSMMLHAALKYDERYQHTATIVADTYRSGYSGPRFFDENGFELQREIVPPLTVFNRGESGEIHVPMDRREAELDVVLARLAVRHEWLNTAEVEYIA